MRLGIVNDMALAAEALRRALSVEPDYEIIWIAQSGEEAVDLCARHTPDLLLLDLIMPGMGGVEATRQIMARSPCAILIATSSIGRNEARVFEAMANGALDVVEIPRLDGSDGAQTAALLYKVALVGRLIRDQAPRQPSLLRPPKLEPKSAYSTPNWALHSWAKR